MKDVTFTKDQVIELLDYVRANFKYSNDTMPWQAPNGDILTSEYLVNAVLIAREVRRREMMWLMGNKEPFPMKTGAGAFVVHFGSNDMYSYAAIMEREGLGFGKMYWYNDEPHIIYLTDLNVSEEYRKKGLGRELQETRERIGKTLGATESRILALKGSWMQKWYERRGYVYMKDHETDVLWVWMRKELQ